jgi:hypothetical protein
MSVASPPKAMTYTMKYSDWQWLIEPEAGSKRYLLKYRRPAAWTKCSTFDSPEAAADAVAKGTTGQEDWDVLKHEARPPNLAAWLIDPTGGALAPIIPVVSDILKAAVLPPTPETGSA